MMMDMDRGEIGVARQYLNQYIDALERSQKGGHKVNMEYYFFDEDYYRDAEQWCGTAACAAGFLSLYHGDNSSKDALCRAKYLTSVFCREDDKEPLWRAVFDVLFGSDRGEGPGVAEQQIEVAQWFLNRLDAIEADRFVQSLSRKARRQYQIERKREKVAA